MSKEKELKKLFKNTINTFHRNKYYQLERNKNHWIHFKNGNKITMDVVEENKAREQKIYEHFQQQAHQTIEEDEMLSFITITLNPLHNNESVAIKEFLSNYVTKEDELLSDVSIQSKMMVKEWGYFLKKLYDKNIKINYVMVKELTSKLNIYLHLINKHKKADFEQILSLLINLNKRTTFGRLEIITESNIINEIPTYNIIESIKFTDKTIIYKKSQDINGLISSGKYVYIRELEDRDNKGNALYKYINKYMKKGIKSNEQVILNRLGLKKITYTHLKLKNHSKKDFIFIINKIQYGIKKRSVNNDLLIKYNINEDNLFKTLYDLEQQGQLIYEDNEDSRLILIDNEILLEVDKMVDYIEKLEVEKSKDDKLKQIQNELHILSLYKQIKALNIKYAEYVAVVFDLPFDYDEEEKIYDDEIEQEALKKEKQNIKKTELLENNELSDEPCIY